MIESKKQILYHQINTTNKNREIEYLKNLQDEQFFLLGIEVTDTDIQNKLHMNIDPQHDGTLSNITSIEYTFNNHNDIYTIINSFDKIIMITIKPDMDSIGSMSILTMLLKNEFKLDGDMILRLKAIAKSDRHGRINWKKRKEDYFKFENYNNHGLPSGLAYMTSDYKLDMYNKVKNMSSYLMTGFFESLKEYNNIVSKNIKKFIKDLNIKVIIPKKLSYITSNYRGAISYGYNYTSTVIAKNYNFIFGFGLTKKQGIKYTIAQYENNKFIDMSALLKELNDLENGWGGSSVIIGSPQDRPSILKSSDVINLTKKFLK